MNTKNLKKLVNFTCEYSFQGEKSSQEMYFNNNTLVYANDEYVFEKKNSNVNTTNRDFYLRNDGKSLQFNSKLATNNVSDTLSFIPEGSLTNYQYNYKTSPLANTTLEVESQNKPKIQITTKSAAILEANTYNETAYPLGNFSNQIYTYTLKSSDSN
jgi:hypothetical protein